MVIYKSFIMSIFVFCPIVWMFTSKKSLDRIQNIQTRTLSFELDDYESECLPDSRLYVLAKT